MCTEKRDSIYIQICILLSRESPEGHETTSNKRICKVTFGKRSVQPEQIPDMKQYNDIILYGDNNSPETQKLLAEYLQQHDSLKVLLSFLTRKMTQPTKMNKPSHTQNCKRHYSFAKERKYHFYLFHKRHDKRYPFFNLLEESHIDFRCIDFPWFYKENLPLIKAVVLYEKLEIRINV